MIRTLRKLLVVFILLTISFTVVYGEDELLSEIKRLEALLLTPCDEPLYYMNELVRIGQSYQEMEKKRLALYKSALDDYQKAISPFIINPDPKTGAQAGIFRARYDQLYEKAKALGLIREASHSDIPAGYNMAQVAARIEQYDEKKGRYDKSVAEWTSKQGLANKLFFVEAQRESMQAIKKEFAQLCDDWEKAREEFFKKMPKEPYKEIFDEIDKIADLMKKEIEPYEKNKEALGVLATSGKYEHCLGPVKFLQTYKIMDESGEPLPLPYNPGKEGTFEGLPGVGFRMNPPAKFEVIKLPTIPDDFPLDLPLKYDAPLHVKTEIERLEREAKAEREAIIAIGKYLSGGENSPVQMLGLGDSFHQFMGESFNVFHGVVEGFASIGNLIIGVGEAGLRTLVDPVGTHNKVQNTLNTIENLVTNSALQRELIDKVGVSIASFGKGIVNGIDLLVSADIPPKDQYDAETLQRWKEYADKTKSAREALTNCERFAGQILADVITGYIIEKGMKAQKLVDDAIKNAEDLAKASQKANKLDDVALAGKLGDDVPKPKVVQELGEQIKKYQDDIARKIDDIVNPKPKDIPYSRDKLPDVNELIDKLNKSSDAGGMNVYMKLDDNLGVKMGKNDIFKSPDVDKYMSSRFNFDIDEAGRKFLNEALSDSNVGRMPQLKDRLYVTEDIFQGRKIYNSIDDIPTGSSFRIVDVVENIPPQTHAATLAKQGKLTEAHLRAYETFMRDLNQKGFVWLDNKLDNFAFETIDASKGLYRVVPLDAGGVYKLADDIPLPPGLSKSDAAKKIQKAFEMCYEMGDKTVMEKLVIGLPDTFEKVGLPKELVGELDSLLGIKKINPTPATVTADWGVGKRITSPGQPFANTYSKIAQESTETLKKQIGKAFDELIENSADYQSALKALNAKKEELANISKKLDDALEKVEDLQKAAKSAEIPKDIDFNWLAAASQQILTEADKSRAMIQCASVKEKILSGIVTDWVKEAWKACKEMGFTFEVAK